MSQNSRYGQRHHESMLSAASVGFFLILIGVLFVTTPNLSDSVVKFFTNFTTAQVGKTNIYIPVPQVNPEDVYIAVRQFCIIWGLFLVALLGARFVFGSSARRLAENVGDVLFWLGGAYLAQIFLVTPMQDSTIDMAKWTTTWFEFWAAIIMLIGVSLIARGFFLAAARLRNK